MSDKVYYTVRVVQGGVEHIDGIGENWNHLKALLHVRRCEYDINNIEYEIIENTEPKARKQEPEIANTLQSTDDTPRGRKSSRKSSQ